MKQAEKDQTPPPEKILFIAPNSGGVDKLLDIAESYELSKFGRMIRIGHSVSREDLNKKFSLDSLSGSTNKAHIKDTTVDLLREDLIKSASIVFCSSHSLGTHILERQIVKFDTVIADDASLLNEVEVL